MNRLTRASEEIVNDKAPPRLQHAVHLDEESRLVRNALCRVLCPDDVKRLTAESHVSHVAALEQNLVAESRVLIQ
jgi:hypothetical protein